MKFLLVVLIGIFFISCESESLEPVLPGELPKNVSFTTNVLPIFSQDCSTSGCHNAGGIAPDLSNANAYNSLVNGGYLNTADPANSSVYKRMIDKTQPMPVSGVLPKTKTDYILGWITEGAKNN